MSAVPRAAASNIHQGAQRINCQSRGTLQNYTRGQEATSFGTGQSGTRFMNRNSTANSTLNP